MGRSPRRTLGRRLAASLAIVVAAAGCGSGDDEPTEASAGSATASPTGTATDTTAGPEVRAADLDGSTFVSKEVTGHQLAADTTVTIGFDGGVMAVAAGCNTQFGAFTVADRTLRWTGAPASTLKACSTALSAQDEWLGGLLQQGMTIAKAGSALTLGSGEVTIRLSAEPGPGPATT